MYLKKKISRKNPKFTQKKKRKENEDKSKLREKNKNEKKQTKKSLKQSRKTRKQDPKSNKGGGAGRTLGLASFAPPCTAALPARTHPLVWQVSLGLSGSVSWQAVSGSAEISGSIEVSVRGAERRERGGMRLGAADGDEQQQ